MEQKPTHAEFLQQRLGPNYVVVHARRKAPRFDSRGFEQQQVTRVQHDAAEREYRALYGDPYDAVRAELYKVLRDLFNDGATWSAMGLEFSKRVKAALEAEANAR